MKKRREIIVCIAAALLTRCAPAPKPVESARDETKELWYAETVEKLAAMNREAESYFEKGKGDDAAALIEKGQPMVKRLLTPPHPTLEAEQAASDLNHLYARMLLSNHHYGWARMLFQQNVARWKHWRPQSPETDRRLKQAQDGIVECDKHLD
jgi:hypothetical protein